VGADEGVGVGGEGEPGGEGGLAGGFEGLGVGEEIGGRGGRG